MPGVFILAISEAFALARKAGVDPARRRIVLLGGFAASRVLDAHGERILKSNYVPGFRTRLFLLASTAEASSDADVHD